jgi:flagellar hook-associated protein 3 FlgL
MMLHLRESFAEVARTQELVSTGIRVSKPSVDPAAANQIMRLEHSLRTYEQFRRNSGAAQVRLTTQESVLNQLGDLLLRGKEIATAQGSDNSSANTRISAAIEVDRILEQVSQLGNTRVGSEFFFGGGMTTTPPFVSGAYVGDDTVRQIRISDEVIVDANLTGRQLLVDSDVLSSLTELRDALLSGSGGPIQDTIAKLDQAYTNADRHLAATGASFRQLESLATTRDNLEFDATAAQSDLRDVPFEEATTQFLSAQTVLEAARAAASRILNTTLTEFLR